ncbi:MAG TPA: HlyD family efflux transporter periplasmic adaptor subunit [Bryobacteraceae bacterium]|nr:HlyD family efflux transporter periplasmic adaptor subunit [Bryobacteraceae bacterium]
MHTSRILKRVILILAVAGVGVLVWLAFRPKPVQVETGRVVLGPLQVTVDEDAETRAHDRFSLAAPVAGRLSRIELHEGDSVGPETVLATISPLPLDPRELAEIKARVQSAEALQRGAVEEAARTEADHLQAQRELVRATELFRSKVISLQQFEQAQTRETGAAKLLQAARFKEQSAAAEVERAKSGLISLEAQQRETGKMVAIHPPQRCRILRILEKSERVVPSGTPIVVLSNPRKIEIVIDLLSTDAVKVKPGAPVIIENWGGPQPLRARVRTVEPYGFTKVSALGIEEQRANVIADFVDSPDGLGDGYRVDARVVIWESPKTLKLPSSALFRSGENWSVFIVEGGRAHLAVVQVGHRNALEAEIKQGVGEGAQVVLHPPNGLKQGSRVVAGQS